MSCGSREPEAEDASIPSDSGAGVSADAPAGKGSSVTSPAQPILVDVDAGGLWKAISAKKNGCAVLVNFWATWCQPCLEELPALLRIRGKYPDALELILVSFDFPESRDKVGPYLAKLGFRDTAYFKAQEDDPFLREMPEAWSGALPFTMIFPSEGDKVEYAEGGRSYGAFRSLVERALGKKEDGDAND